MEQILNLKTFINLNALYRFLSTKNGFLKFPLRRSSEIMKPTRRHVKRIMPISAIIYHLVVIRMISIWIIPRAISVIEIPTTIDRIL
ncbi:hypothetical protein Lepto1548_10710 [Leptospira interrogans serovar Bataviae]|nr:hypothetical protein Lepto1548_10710 [Leptospira interrogans serovar Bataviae]